MKNLNKTFLALALSFTFILVQAQTQSLAWGDQGNGTYVNPVLNVDYSDPDVIRVGEKYYMVASDFNYMGMQVMESDDMVNWKYISQVYDHFDVEGWDEMKHYAGGCWAPALVEHNGRYYVYFCTPDEGLFMSSATNPRGPWSPLHCVKSIKGWEDPCPFWDEDGQAYLGHSRVGAGPIIIHKMSADGKQLLDDGLTVYTGPVAEGTKFLKHEGYYFLIIPEGGVGTGWQTALRSKNIYGPYEKKVILEQGVTAVNGPHQGNLIATPEGEWWLFHFQDTPAQGRVVHLQPVRWLEGWPMAGVDQNMNGIGEPVYVWKKPNFRTETKAITITEAMLPAHSDEFSGEEMTYKGERKDGLGLQWQWNHNPVHEKWSLTERKGWLTLEALPAPQLMLARNTLSQKVMGYAGEAMTQLDASAFAESTRAGLCVLGSQFAGIGICKKNGKLQFYTEVNGQVQWLGNASKTAYLRVNVDGTRFQLEYSSDGKHFAKAGDAIDIHAKYWKGPRLGLFCYNETSAEGKARFNYFRYEVMK